MSISDAMSAAMEVGCDQMHDSARLNAPGDIFGAAACQLGMSWISDECVLSGND